jgi:hypothetical protein
VHKPQPTWLSSKRGLEGVTGERLEIERLTSRSEEGRWKSTHRGNSLAAYPTSSPVLEQRWARRLAHRLSQIERAAQMHMATEPSGGSGLS